MKYFYKRMIWHALSLSLILFIIFAVGFVYLESQLPNVELLKNVKLQTPLRIYTRDHQLIAKFGEKKRTPISYDEIPPQLISALLATEDRRFFEHSGVDIIGLSRAALKVITTGTKSQGGSTITMQVARNFFLSRQKTYLRKIKEILLAIKIDNELSKEKILELYLNKIYLGNRAYGVAEASKVYYGKPLRQLNLAQLAMIAGLPQAPSAQNPLANPTLAIKRRNHVLKRMLDGKYISREKYINTIKEPISASYHVDKIGINAPFVAEMIRKSLYKHFGKNAYTNGYQVYTTIDSKLQKSANEALIKSLLAYDQRHGFRGAISKLTLNDEINIEELQKELKKYPNYNKLIPAIVINVADKSIDVYTKNKEQITITWDGLKWARKPLKKGYVGAEPKNAQQIVSRGDLIYIAPVNSSTWTLSQVPQVEGALIALSPQDGSILALTGGFSFTKSKFNRVTQASRQPGSSFKPFIYSAALAKGFTLATTINDAPIVMNDPSQTNLWRPENDNHQFYGPTRLRIGLIHSRNLVSIRLLKAIQIPYAIDYLKNFGFNPEEIPHSLSLALGSLDLSPLELAKAYAVFANGGFNVSPYIISNINDTLNNPIISAKPQIACPQCENDPSPTIPVDQQASRAISPQIAYLMTKALQDVIQNGTGRGAKVLNRSDLSGKTGTTNEQKDAWFTGFNRDIVTISWVGFDDPISLHEYAAKAALPMWIDFMRDALQGKPKHTLSQPKNIITVRIDPKTGLLANSQQQNSIFEMFRKKHVPTQYANNSSREKNNHDNEEPLF